MLSSTGPDRRPPRVALGVFLAALLALGAPAWAQTPPSQPPVQPPGKSGSQSPAPRGTTEEAAPATRGTAGLPTEPSPMIRIVSATFGNAAVVGKNCSALDVVRRACNDRLRCQVPISPDLCGPQAELSLFPELLVEYRCQVGEKVRLVKQVQPFPLRLSCVESVHAH